MSIAKKLIIIFFTLFIACGESPKKEEIVDKNPLPGLEGFWKRIGTIQTVNDIPVDTIFIGESETPELRQIKVFYNGHIAWMNNDYNQSNPWTGGTGMYGKYKINSEESITESISHGSGGSVNWIHSYKDSLGVNYRDVNLGISLSGNYHSLNVPPVFEGMEGIDERQNPTAYMELWEKMPEINSETKADGVWKRVYEIQYVNGIPVDTVSVPSDGTLDVHFRKNGRFLYQVDNAGISEPGDDLYWGYGGYGQYDLIDEKSIMEYHEYVSGRVGRVRPQTTSKTNGGRLELEFYNDDMFKQVQIDSMGKSTRGVVYRRAN